jgi:peptidoglycan/xylan/chitin deacetylase (PgdA/CDA1 family)
VRAARWGLGVGCLAAVAAGGLLLNAGGTGAERGALFGDEPKRAPRYLQDGSAAGPAHLTSEQDHQRTMELLHINELRSGPSGDPKAPNAANVDEAKVPAYTLPDPLTLNNGKKVTSATVWWNERRPEIVELFDREIYGRTPAHTPGVKWEVVSTTHEKAGSVPVVTKKLVGHVDNSAYPQITVDIQLSLSAPENARGPVPVMMEFGLSPEVLAAIRKRMTEAQLAALNGNGPSWQEQVAAKGWGYATLIPTSVQADNGEGLTQGIIGLVNKGQPRKLDDWGALKAWAWGASRALDYLETDKAVNAKAVGIEGLSRYGKAALVTMAYDQRFAIGFIASSGEGGAKILRRKFGEQVENVAGPTEYHWMAGNFLKYAGPLTPNDLPVDAHELIALCAPRPVFVSSGSLQVEGGWIDAKGMFLGAVGAGPVYRLLGKKDLGTTEFPPMETALVDGDIAWRQHTGGHTAGPNWPTFLIFASRYFLGPDAANAVPVPNGANGVTPSSPHGENGDPPAERHEAERHEVALTFDDFPSHGPLPDGLSRVDIINSIIHALQAAHAPRIYGFVNAKTLEKEPGTEEVLKLWRDAGFPLGNHTFSHMDLDKNTADAWERDVLEGEPILKQLMGDQDWHWLRFPYLHEGNTAPKHVEAERFLSEHRYRVAEVTLSFGDYAYNEPYARCVEKKDTEAIDWMKGAYERGAEASLTHGIAAANRLFGRDVKHIMLLHIGGFETVMLPKLLEILNRRGFALITLPDAASDPAYEREKDLTTHVGGTFLQELLVARNIQETDQPEDPPARLNELCR